MKIKYSHKVIAFFLAINILQSVLPYNLLFASNNGPNAPEASGFESVNATDMVNLTSGDMSYVLPLTDVGGLPISLSYHGGVPLDLESTWTGLGWNLNTGAINRGLNATPDDWNGGNSIDFIRYTDSEEIYQVTVGVGIAKAAEVGVGASWGSNKALSGSVFASMGIAEYGGASASIDTNGNYTLGVSAGTGKGGEESFGGGFGISGNVNGGKTSMGVSAGYRSAGGMSIGVGSNLDGGMSASLGYSDTSGNGMQTKGGAGGGSLSTGSFSSGDWEISSKGWFIPVQIYMVSLGFGKQKITYKLKKAYKKQGYGSLYTKNQNTANDAIEIDGSADTYFSDYQNRFRYGDAYDQALPVTEKEFVADYDAEREKLNFTFAAYDSYDVNASGISGIMQPKILQNSTQYGLGYIGTDAKNRKPSGQETGKMKVYWHNSLTTDKTFGTNNPSDIDFYFNGQFTQNTTITPLTPLNNNFSTLQSSVTNRQAVNNNRLKQGNFVEVYTNQQIRNNQAAGLLSPIEPTSNGLNLSPLSRSSAEYKNEGIGGYKITAPDGKVYHFSQPVYHYEMVERNVLKDTTQNNVSEKRQYSSYATHWLLSTITGPDFIDTNNNNVADSEDFGYWVRMDYGKWSEGYVWRNPTDKKLKDYTTNIESNIGEKDYGTYQFGRKQLYYLDKVVSATHTAYFVKNLRYDSAGCDLNYSFGLHDDIPNEGTGGGIMRLEEDFTYKRQMQLMLEKIVVVKNSDANVSKGSNSDPLYLNNSNLPNYVKSYQLNFSPSGGFYQEYGNPTILINNESGVYDAKDFESFDYGKAIKVIDMQYNYNLAVRDHTNSLSNPDKNKSDGSPGTVYNPVKNPNKGKLCLKSVRFLGRNNFDYMPPYQFEYKGEYKGPASNYIKYPANAIVKKNSPTSFSPNWMNNTMQQVYAQGSNIIRETPIANARAKDEWGFLKDLPNQENQVMAAAWTMTQIKTPTGASIDFEHEEDDFYTEAFSRRYWTDNLKFKVSDLGTQVEILIEKEDGNLNDVDFNKYFDLNEEIFLDFWLCRKLKEHCGTFNLDVCTRKGIVDVTTENPSTVFAVSSTFVKLRIKKTPASQILTGPNSNQVLNMYFSKNSTSSGSNIPEALPRNGEPDFSDLTCGIGPGCPDHWTMTYKLLANKVPKDETGGGLRVKSITLNDEVGNSYKTRYYYNVPGTGKNKTDVNYRSSGITSYSPVRGQKFVPYQSELPSPGVMYEYVTMVAQDLNNNSLGETRYRFYTLKPVLDIFNENIEMKDDDGTTIFKANVVNSNTSGTGYLNPTAGKKIKAKQIKLDVNTSLIGQFRSIEEYNKAGQLMSKTEKKYLSGTALKAFASLPDTDANKIHRGSITESFQSMKSVFITDPDNNNQELVDRFLSVSTKEDYGSVLQSVVTTGMHGKSTETYKRTDPETGAFMVVETNKPDGTIKRVERIPAYRKYPELGSKTVDINNKHMLSQETMVVSSVLKNNIWRATDASINTWKNEWNYRDNFGNEDLSSPNVWRKHKTFTLNQTLSTNYSAIFANSNVNFDWNTNTSGVTTDNFDQWKKTSEIMRYNHYSMPLEVKDINNNCASSKMADNNSKVLVSGNARYTEMYYSGAEFIDGDVFFEGEVRGAQYRTSDVAHTGYYSVIAKKNTDQLFEVNGTSGPNDYYDNPEGYTAAFRPGKYKVSFWVLEADEEGPAEIERSRENSNSDNATELVFNGNVIDVSEIVNAGCWKQFNYYIDILPDESNTIFVRNIHAPNNTYYDDFRLHPITSSISSFVYDNKTDELSYTLDSNNMGTAFRYDDAGRLKATYIETENHPNLQGGFKITSQLKQKYKGSNENTVDAPTNINNCLSINHERMAINIKNECIASFENRFKTYVTGGSGNFSYQYKWLVNVATDQYSGWTNGNQTQVIPYAAKICQEFIYDKMWSFIVKVTDNVTGEVKEEIYTYSTEGCQFDMKQWADLQITKCNTFCGEGPYSFKVHLKDISREGNFIYEYADYVTYLPFNEQYFVNVTNTDGNFCPKRTNIEDRECPSGYRDYIMIAYRITDVNTGISSGGISTFIGDCMPVQSIYPIIQPNSFESKYIQKGNLIKYTTKGDVEEIINVDKGVK